jgi:hypothetical protein
LLDYVISNIAESGIKTPKIKSKSNKKNQPHIGEIKKY